MSNDRLDLDTLALLPWWGWLIAYAPLAAAAISLTERLERVEFLERIGLKLSDSEGRSYLPVVVLMVYVVFALYAEGYLR